MKSWTLAVPRPAERPDPEGGAPPLAVRELSRRLDWRFLLPDPGLGRVAYVGGEELLGKALQRFADAFVPVNPELDASEADGEASDRDVSDRSVSDCDVSVVASRRIQDLRCGIARLRPGGHLYWEVDRLPRFLRPGRGRSGRRSGGAVAGGFLRDPRRILHSLGMVDVQVAWTFPDVRRPKVILSPDPAAVRYATEMRSRRTFGLARCVRAASRMDLLPRILPTLGVVARRPGGRPTGEGIAATALLDQQVPGWEGHPLSWIVVARPVASFVVTVLLDPEGGTPVAVVKAVRTPGDRRAREALTRESRGLDVAGKAGLPEPSSVPSVIALDEREGSEQLAISGVPGRNLSRRELLRDPEHWVTQVTQWLAEVHRATGRPTDDSDSRIDRLVHGPLGKLERHLQGKGGCGDLIDRARHLTDPLLRMELPSVVEHGDLCCSNVLVTPTGRVSVVDWELTETGGYPGTDLFFFLASVAVTREKARSWDEKLDALGRAFRASDGWARPWISRYWHELGLPKGTLDPLFVCFWTRCVARLLERPDKALVKAGGAAFQEVLSRHHHFRFWRQIVESQGTPVPAVPADATLLRQQGPHLSLLATRRPR